MAEVKTKEKKKRTVRKRAASPKDTGRTKAGSAYDRYKKYQGKQYSGMKVGGTHKWYYDKGVWRDKKTSPDQWDITFEVIKRRAGKAPKGLGAPVGTEYHWFILADQFVEKMDANSYHTRMEGIKLKIAHKRADKEEWNVKTEKGRKKRLIRLLKKYVAKLEQELSDD